jgi:hypothetical protein
MPSPDDLPGARDPISGNAATTVVGARSNGHGPGPGAPVAEGSARRPPGPSTKPALIVLGVILLLFLLGIALEIVSGSQSRPTAAPTSIATARGAVLRAVPARPLLKAITVVGQPPEDLLNALAVPRGATPVPTSAVDLGVELYDRSLRFEVPATEQAVISFFRAQLPAQHWRRLSQGPAAKVPGYQILEQHPASDGHEWEIGVTVSPTAFPPAHTPGAQTPGTPSTSVPSTSVPAPTGDTTSFTLRLFSVSDQA